MAHRVTRRSVVRLAAWGGAAALCPGFVAAAEPFRLRYALPSCMYGTMRLAEVLPQVRAIGAEVIDLWPKVHGDQREQVEAMGRERFASMLREQAVRLGAITRYDLGPLKLRDEMKVLRELGGSIILTGSQGPVGLAGDVLRSAVRQFAEELGPHVAAAEESGVTIGIENHGQSLIESPDSMRWLVEFVRSKHLGIALAPYHLPQGERLIARLIDDLGERLVHFYAWQRGMGCTTKLPKEQELLQMPGRGPLDFGPILAALRKVGFGGYTEVFMHPVPRGLPILDTAERVTEEINRSRAYLDSCLKKVNA